MFSHYFWVILILFNHSSSYAVGQCDPVIACTDFQEEIIISNQSVEIPDWENETDIARRRSWQGISPQDYSIHLEFQNRSHYSGSVNVTFTVASPKAKQIMINHGANNPSVNYSAIIIRPLCEKSTFSSTPDIPIRRRRAGNSNSGCIEKATFLEGNETLVLHLRGVKFNEKPGSKYVISFPYFDGRSSPHKSSPIGAAGLVESTFSNQFGHFSATTTIFQMRLARTVFPCFDHPSLKARFKLCIQRPDEISVAGNTPISKNQTKTIGSMKRDCFEPTPKISTYVFTFALMENYTTESLQAPDGGLLVEVLAPINRSEELRWMLNETINAVKYFENITKFKFPLKRLAFVSVYSAPFWGVENLGLVTVEGGFMQHPNYDTAYTILYHEIVHQWLGDLVTIGEWREICLQEGLTAYFEWKLSTDRDSRHSLDDKADHERIINQRGAYYQPYAMREYKQTQDIADWCYGRPSLFFHTVKKTFGFGALEELVAKLIQMKPYGVADLDTWDTALANVTYAGMKGYLKGWFLQPGPLYLLVSKSQNQNCIIIRQKVYGGNVTVTPARVIPLNVEIYSSQHPKIIAMQLLNETETEVCSINGTFLVDPEGNSLTRKVYHADTYRLILESTAVNDSHVKKLVNDFCNGLFEDVLPLPDEPATTKPSDWLDVYTRIKNSMTGAGALCQCCLNSKEENEKTRDCKFKWDMSGCRSLRLNKFVGYNYTFINQTESIEAGG